MSKHLIDFIGISKSYDSNLVLDDLNLYIRENEFLTLLGPSGCGKTTTLRLLGGFESPDKGQILFDGQDITALAAWLHPLFGCSGAYHWPPWPCEGFRQCKPYARRSSSR